MGRPQKLQRIVPVLWRILAHFWPYTRRQRSLLSVSVLALLAEVGLRILEPWPLKFVFDYVIAVHPDNVPPSLGPIEDLGPGTMLALLAFAVVAIASLRAAVSYGSTVGFALAGQRVLTEVRGQLYRHLQFLSLSFHNKARSGDLVVRVMGDVAMLREVLVTALVPLLTQVLILVGMLSLMIWFSWKLALLALLTLPLFWLRTVRLSRKIHQAARKQRQRRGAMAATAAESIGAIRTVQALSLQDSFAETFVRANRRNLTEGVKTKRLSARLERTADAVTAVATAVVLFFGARSVLERVLTPGDLLVFLFYLKQAFRPAKDFAKYTGRLAKATAAGERIMDVLKRVPEIRDLPGAVPAPPLRGAVEFSSVDFGYEPSCPTLRDIEFSVEPGRLVMLAGASGSGKSTLVSLILRLYDPTRGEVRIDGRDIRDYTLASLRAQISVVLQDNLLFVGSVRDNIASGQSDVTMAEIESAARLANVHDFIESLPNGYDTQIGERGGTVSHGQRQRISVARAALRKAPILILDEPTSGLDEENALALVESLQELTRNRTTFLVTHDLRLGTRADLILYLDRGRLTEIGNHRTLIRSDGPYAALYRQRTSELAAGYLQGGPHALAR